MSRFRRTALALAAATTLPLGALTVLAPPSQAAPAGWHTSGATVVTPSGAEFRIAGVNWYGFETADAVAHGLYSQSYRTVLDAVRSYGYNTVRIPFSNQMWETDPAPRASSMSACADCAGLRSRDVLALIVNYAGSIGLHVILDNHRSEAGNSAEGNGLWYASSGGKSYPESSWRRDWVGVQQWAHGVRQTLGATDTVTVTYLAADGAPTVLGYDLRNEPHTPARTAYLTGATWGSGDGIDPAANPNPNPYAPSCVAASTCHDWRLAAERAGDDILGDADAHGWSYPLLFVEGIGEYPTATGNAASGPYDGTWWGGDLQGVNGNAGNPGAPVVFNAGGTATSLGPAVANQLVYSAHDYGPSEYQQSWFNAGTCYASGCGTSSLADVWRRYWAFVNLAGGVAPVWPGHASYPWANTGAAAYAQAPIYLGEFGTGNAAADLGSATAGSQGQWFTDLVHLVRSSYGRTAADDPGYALTSVQWTYWALNTEDGYGLLGTGYTGLANPAKEYTYLCAIQQAPFAVPAGPGTGQCGSTGALPAAR